MIINRLYFQVFNNATLVLYYNYLNAQCGIKMIKINTIEVL